MWPNSFDEAGFNWSSNVKMSSAHFWVSGARLEEKRPRAPNYSPAQEATHRGQALHCTAHSTLHNHIEHGCSAQHWTSVGLYILCCTAHSITLLHTELCTHRGQALQCTILIYARTLYTAQDCSVEKEQHREQVLDWTEVHTTQHCTAHKRGKTGGKCYTTQ